MNKLSEVIRKIETCREKLNQELENGKTFNELYIESLELDKLIEDYLNLVME